VTLLSFAEEYSALSSGEQAQFAEALRRLLAEGLLWREEADDRHAYAFLIRRRDLVADYLQVAGWEVRFDERNGIFSVAHRDGAHRRRLDLETTHWLLLLRLLYAERLEDLNVTLHRFPVVSIGEIIRRYQEFFPQRVVRKKTSLDRALGELRSLKLIRVAGGSSLRTNDGEQLIELLPALEVIVPASAIADIAAKLNEYQRRGTSETDE
jgi:Domain of unknown function (DUF4194)